MDELVAPSLCAAEDADVTCISDGEKNSSPTMSLLKSQILHPVTCKVGWGYN